MEYLSHKWPLICYHRVCSTNNTTGNTSGTGTADQSGAPEFTPVCSGVRVARSLVFCVMFCRSLFILYLLAFDFLILITLLVSSNFSKQLYIWNRCKSNWYTISTFLFLNRKSWLWSWNFIVGYLTDWSSSWYQLSTREGWDPINRFCYLNSNRHMFYDIRWDVVVRS
jgi:hypothetical protein